MPQLDYMVLADHVRADAGGLHILGAGIDTIATNAVPTSRDVGLAIRFVFDSTEEPGTKHAFAILFQDDDRVLATVNGAMEVPPRPSNVPVHWKTGAVLALPTTLPFLRYGDYSLELLIDDQPVKSIDLRVTRPQVV